jgi:transcriptional regulator
VYLPEHFAETKPDELQRIIRENPLGMLVTHTASGLDANHLPFELDADRGSFGTLQAHIARANPLWKEVSDGAEVLVVFRGAQGYISPNWYPSKHETHRHVPTWNYEVVHAHGRIRLIDDVKFVGGLVARLTLVNEAAEPRPWKMADAPRDYLEQMLRMIVGIEIEVTRLSGKRKLGQNRETRDVQGAIRALQERGRQDLSSAMARANPQDTD